MPNQNLKAKVYEVLRDRIVYLEYEPGTALEEKALCQEFGVSRTPLKEALLELKSQGLVKIYPRSGTYVAPIDILELKDLYVVKRSLEGLAAELAALRISASDLRKLESLLSRLSEPHPDRTLRELVRIDQDFHYTLHLASMNQPLTQMLENIHYRCLRRWFHFIDRIPELQEPVVANLPEVLDALKRRQPAQARAAMEKHVSSFIAAFSKILN